MGEQGGSIHRGEYSRGWFGSRSLTNFEEKSRELIDAIANPMQRLGEPEDVAEVVSLLAGPGRWVNGQTIYANGGAI